MTGRQILSGRSVRGKLTQILAISLAIILGLIGYAMVGELSRYRAVTEAVEPVPLALTIQDSIHELQRERGMTNGLLGGDTRFADTIADQRHATDAALRDLRGHLEPDEHRVADALRTLDGLASVRTGTDTRSAGRAQTFDFYTTAIVGLTRVELTGTGADDTALRDGLAALRTLGDVKETAARERGFLNGVFAAGRFTGDDYVRFSEIRAAKLAAADEFGRHATAEQNDRFTAVLGSIAATTAARYEHTALLGAAGPVPGRVDPLEWWSSMTKVIDDLRDVQRSIGQDIAGHADALHRDAVIELLLAALAAVAVVLVLIRVVYKGIRSITSPLARLARDADTVAGTHLPEAIAAVQDGSPPEPLEPVGVSVGDSYTEITVLAGAIDRVRTSAMTLATEQAVLRHNARQSLANLGRRNQSLLRRQISAISEFERTELDPDALGRLFLLDHLATRMRRNSESLLVLVGETGPRRPSAPVSIVDAVRAAVSEVEDYTRVRLRDVDPVFVPGSIVPDVAHLLAELIENGLTFSPPDREVEVRGRRVADGYLLVIVDHGIGMPAEALAEANAKFRGEDTFLVAPTRFLGHHVIGALAANLGARVRLVESPTSGVSARVLLPTALLAEPRPVPPSPPEHHSPRPIERPVERPAQRPSKAIASLADGGERTSSGLPKRSRRPVPARQAPTGTDAARPPDDVRVMLSSFRDGHRRGSRTRPEPHPVSHTASEKDQA
ncbi:signal transduction histidine kinase [Herbihabitans rhizosphaerae]|uniref:histidine kinase n=1 Tax=Herbihabitans rhizosphaerae TaxID=1872711 RepID=A0A4Q7KVU5_9PSEU|nr:nitrate- and nitrite sensing domain-containing protein [Herbihabitans rhizosphaerae]RZS40767.1 signal transduction histidine kinase [Herbihabitans rhizosphaerae]